MYHGLGGRGMGGWRNPGSYESEWKMKEEGCEGRLNGCMSPSHRCRVGSISSHIHIVRATRVAMAMAAATEGWALLPLPGPPRGCRCQMSARDSPNRVLAKCLCSQLKGGPNEAAAGVTYSAKLYRHGCFFLAVSEEK